jgi:hypothetical protein
MKRIAPWVVLAAVAAAGYVLGTRPWESAAKAPASGEALAGSWVFDASALVEAVADRAWAARSARNGSGATPSEERRAAEDALAPASEDPALRATVRELFAGTSGRFEVRGDGTASLSMSIGGAEGAAADAVEGTWERRGDLVTFTPRLEPGASAAEGPPTTFAWTGGTLHLLVGGDAKAVRVPLRRL